jgi:ribulose-phosphate 3-epimerase
MVEEIYQRVNTFLRKYPFTIAWRIRAHAKVMAKHINPDEEISLLEPYLDKIDKVLIMSVVPGKGGQQFMESVISKIDELNELKDKYHFITSIDGGINDETIKLINDKNIDLVVSGSYITNQEDYNEAIKELKKQV